MTRNRITIDDARHMEYGDLLDRGHALLREYEAGEMETPEDLDARIAKTLDELPDIYAWFLHLHAWFDHWADFYMNQFGNKSLEYKGARQKRDAMEKLASAAKLRYEGTSRRLTQLQTHESESRMPRSRS